MIESELKINPTRVNIANDWHINYICHGQSLGSPPEAAKYIHHMDFILDSISQHAHWLQQEVTCFTP